jgi:hypothetical protein
MATPTNLPSSFTAGQVLTAAQMNDLRGGFRILNIVSTFKNDVFTTGSATFVDITGFSATITPQATSNKILVVASISAAVSNANIFVMNLVRDSINIAQPSGGANPGTLQSINQLAGQSHVIIFLDSPNTTSATTYKVQTRCNGGTVNVNRAPAATDFTSISTLTLLEVSA